MIWMILKGGSYLFLSLPIVPSPCSSSLFKRSKVTFLKSQWKWMKKWLRKLNSNTSTRYLWQLVCAFWRRDFCSLQLNLEISKCLTIPNPKVFTNWNDVFCHPCFTWVTTLIITFDSDQSTLYLAMCCFVLKLIMPSHISYLYQIAHLGDDDDEPEFSSAMPLEEGDTFFFAPRSLKNLVLVDEMESLSPVLACHIADLGKCLNYWFIKLNFLKQFLLL